MNLSEIFFLVLQKTIKGEGKKGDCTPSENTGIQLWGALGFISEPGGPSFSGDQECTYRIKVNVPAVSIPGEV